MKPKKVAIIGGGVIGLSIGWRLAEAGCAVEIFDRDEAGKGASWAAAGMLSALSEASYAEQPLLTLGLESHRIYADFVQDLEKASSMTVGFRTEGTLAVAIDRDDREALEHQFETQKKLHLDVTWLSGAEARDKEPLLSPRVNCALLCKEEYQVDNRLMVAALIEAFRRAGGKLHENKPVESVVIQGGRAQGVIVHGEIKAADAVLLAAGCWSGKVGGIPQSLLPPVRPVKGQVIALQMKSEKLNMVVHAPGVYLVPKDQHRLVIGATVEELGFDTQITAGGLYQLLDAAWEAVPAISEMPVLETWAGLRPGSRDNAPILGATAVENLFMATGHFRKGILLTPVTAREMTSLILDGHASEWIAPFSPARFQTTVPAPV